MEDHRDLIWMELPEALAEKYQRGRERYGPEWGGSARPLVALHDEVLDAIVYADLEYARASEPAQTALLEIIKTLADVRRGVVTLLDSMPESEWDGWDL